MWIHFDVNTCIYIHHTLIYVLRKVRIGKNSRTVLRKVEFVICLTFPGFYICKICTKFQISFSKELIKNTAVCISNNPKHL